MSPAAKAVKKETLSILSLDDDFCVRNGQAHQASIAVRCCLQFYITHIEVEAARSRGPHGSRPDPHVLRDKNGEHVFAGLKAVHQDKEMMKEIVVEDDSAIRKSEIDRFPLTAGRRRLELA